MNPAKIVIEGEVSPEFLQGLQALQRSLAGAREAAEKVGQVRDSGGLDALRERLEGVGRTARSLNEIREAAGAAVSAVSSVVSAFTQAAIAGDLNARAVNGLRGGYDTIARETNGAVTALAAYRAQQTLVNSGLRISSEELATVTRHAREHRDVTKSAEEAVQELSEALRNGEAEGLRKFGIAVEQGADRAHTFESALRQMREAADGLAPSAQTLGEAVTSLSEGTQGAASGLAALAASGLGLDTVVGNLSRDIRRLASDLTELNARRQTAARDAADLAERERLLADYRRNYSDVAQALRDQGMDTNLLPAQNPNGLSHERLVAATGALASIRAEVDPLRRTSANDIRLAPGAADTRVTGAPSRLGPNLAESGADVNAAINTLQAARSGNAAIALDDARQALETRLRSLTGEIQEGLDERNNPGARDRAGRPAQPTTPTPPAAHPAGGAANDNAVRLTDEQRIALSGGAGGLGGSALSAALSGANEIAAPYGSIAEMQRIAGQETALRGREATDAAAARERGNRNADAAIAAETARAEEEKRDEASTRSQQLRLDRERAFLDERARINDSFSEQYERTHRRQANAVTASVDMSNSAIEKFGSAFGKHVNLIAAGQEAIGEGVLNMVSEVVTGIGQEAIVKAAMETAEGVAMAAGVYTAPLAPGHFAAAAAFAAVGAAALGAGAILGAVRGSSGGGATASAAPPAMPPATQSDAHAGGAMNLTIVYGSGVLGTPHDLARHIRDTMVEGEQRGIRVPSRVMERAA